MRIAAYQFPVSGSIEENFKQMKMAIQHAAELQVRLLIFPECALTGYPPYDLPTSAHADLPKALSFQQELQHLSEAYDIYLIAGSVTSLEKRFYNSALLFSPTAPLRYYHKRALWGWDRDNFSPGAESGIFEVDGIKIGIRVCFEVRFPEYFRELYLCDTALNVILFYDRSDYDDVERYDLIKAHIRTRAVENVCHILTVDTISPFQTAPTALFDKSGKVLGEADRNKSELFFFDLEDFSYNFGEKGRKEISNQLLHLT